MSKAIYGEARDASQGRNRKVGKTSEYFCGPIVVFPDLIVVRQPRGKGRSNHVDDRWCGCLHELVQRRNVQIEVLSPIENDDDFDSTQAREWLLKHTDGSMRDLQPSICGRCGETFHHSQLQFGFCKKQWREIGIPHWMKACSQRDR